MTTHLDLTGSAEQWRLYQFDTDLDCGLRCGPGAHDLYDGLSNEPLRRVLEHAKTKPWWRHVTGWRQLPEVYATEAEARSAEKAMIRSRLPLANEVHNLDNPHRLVFTPAPRAARAVARRRPAAVGPATARRLSRTQKRAATVGVAWSVLSGLAWWTATAAVGLAGWSAPLAGTVAATLLMLAGWWLTVEVRRWWTSRRARRQRRRLALTAAAVTLFAGVGVVLYLLVPAVLAFPAR